jgi:hypothetical protein
MKQLQDLIVWPGILFERVSSGRSQLLKCNINGDLVDVQVNLQPSQDHIDLVIANSRNATNSSRYTCLAAAAFKTVNIEYKSLVTWGTLLEIQVVGSVTLLALFSW